MKIDDTYPRNYTELTVEQSENSFTIVSNPEIDQCFSAIPICIHIINNDIHQLYQLNGLKRIKRVYDKKLDDLLKRMAPFMEVQAPQGLIVNIAKFSRKHSKTLLNLTYKVTMSMPSGKDSLHIRTSS